MLAIPRNAFISISQKESFLLDALSAYPVLRANNIPYIIYSEVGSNAHHTVHTERTPRDALYYSYMALFQSKRIHKNKGKDRDPKVLHRS